MAEYGAGSRFDPVGFSQRRTNIYKKDPLNPFEM